MNSPFCRSASLLTISFALLQCLNAAWAQSPTFSVPRIVNYSGVARDTLGKPVSGVIGATFAIYANQEGGSPLWIETQNVNASASGSFTVMLGSTASTGLPGDLFSAGQARWLGITFNGETEQPRVALVSVPYAMQAGDAMTLNGLPASTFALAASAASPSSSAPGASARGASTNSGLPPLGGSGTADFVPLWTDSTGDLGNSALFQAGSGASVRIGVNTTTPGATLDIKGTELVRGILQLPSLGTATATSGFNSQPLDQVASSFSSGAAKSVNQTFQWQAEPAGNDTANPSATLNLLFGLGSAKPAETGLKISNAGLFTFAAGQTFPGTGTITGVSTASGSGLSGGGSSGNLALTLTNTCSANQILKWNGNAWACSSAGTGTGTVTSVGLTAPTSDFIVNGSPITSAGTLKLGWNVAPTNADTANAIVKRDATGSFNATSITGTGTFSTTTANVNAITGSTSLDGGSAIVGSATATGGNNRVYGVTGSSVSTVAGSTGVLGLDGNTNTSETGGFTMGVQGASSNQFDGMGVFGFDGTSLSSAFDILRGGYGGVGVWGDGGTGALFANIGVIGTMDDGPGGLFVNNSPGGYDALDAYAYSAGSNPFLALNYVTSQYCDVDSLGNLNCSGSKNAVVPVDGGKRIVAMSAIEAPQNWFEDAGELQLVNGAAVVQLDSTYTQTVNSNTTYQVFLTPYGDCKGLYVSNRMANSFEVHELGGGTATLSFGYRILALRKNYEQVRFADHTHDLDAHKRMMARMNTKAVQPRAAAFAAKR